MLQNLQDLCDSLGCFPKVACFCCWVLVCLSYYDSLSNLNLEQKVAKFYKTQKDIHQSTLENPKYLHQWWFKTGSKPVFHQTFKSSQKSSQNGKVAKRKFWHQIGVISSQICDKCCIFTKSSNEVWTFRDINPQI